MTVVARSDLDFSIPPTQNTAPVLEFRCLYTLDIRRKAKRWQDGFLKFHTFNKRVMVYDVPRNFIGDTHWQDATTILRDGDEISLERSGALVQVGEQVGLTETDLSVLLAKRPVKPMDGGPACGTRGADAKAPSRLQTRSFNVPPKTPTRWTGRAIVPLESPFELRHKQSAQDHWDEGRTAKRQRRDDSHVPLWELLETSKAPKAGHVSSAVSVLPTMFMTADLRTSGKGLGGKSSNKINTSLGQTSLKYKELVDLTSTAGDQIGYKYQTKARPNQEISQSQVDRCMEKIDAQDVITERAIEEHNVSRAWSSRRTNAFPFSSSTKQYASHRRGNDKPPSGPENCGNDAQELHAATKDSLIRTSSVREGRKTEVPKAIPPKISITHLPPPVSVATHMAPLDRQPPTTVMDTKHSDKARSKALDRPMKSLRLSNHAPRNMLLCQTLGYKSSVKPPRPPNLSSNLNLGDEESLGTTPKASQRSCRDRPIRGPEHIASPPVMSSTPAFATQQAYFEATQPRQSNDDSLHALSLGNHAILPTISDDHPPVHGGTIPTTNTTTFPQLPKSTARPPQLKHDPPREYSHLDAQLLSKPFLLPVTDLVVQPSHMTPPNAASALKPSPPPRQANRTLARALSDTAVGNPQRRQKQPWRRTETIAHPGAVADGRRAQWQGEGKERENEKEKDGDVGPWSREAWDLFGWCPEGKWDVLGWSYGDLPGRGGVQV